MSQEANSRRLRAIIAVFNVPHTAVAEAGKVSPAYISRLLSEKDGMTASDEFWRKMENALPKLIEQRRGQIFEVKAAPVEKIDGLREISGR